MIGCQPWQPISSTAGWPSSPQPARRPLSRRRPLPKTIPIVFTAGGDPVELRLVASWSRPGGNMTKRAHPQELSREVAPKRLELAHELIPTATVLGLLTNPQNPSTETLNRGLLALATSLGLQLKELHASTEAEIDQAFTTFRQTGAGVLIIGNDTFFAGSAQRIGALSIRHSVPTIFQYPEFTAAGGLAGYGGGIIKSYRLAGGYTGRSLSGEKPSDQWMGFYDGTALHY